MACNVIDNYMDILWDHLPAFGKITGLSKIVGTAKRLTLKPCLSPSSTNSNAFWWAHYSSFSIDPIQPEYGGRANIKHIVGNL